MKIHKTVTSSFSSSNPSFLDDVMSFIDSSLKDSAVNIKLIQKTELIAEEMTSALLSHAPENARLKVQIIKSLNETTINLSMKGEEFAPYSDADDIDEDADEDIIRSVLLRAYGESFKYRHKNKVNHVRIVAGQTTQKINNSAMLKELFEAMNTLFLTITAIIASFIPVAAFVSISLLIMRLNMQSLLSILSVAFAHITGIILMMGVYGLLILVLARLNPIKFYKKDKEGIITSFTLSSSSAAMPTNMRMCTEMLGVPQKVSSFSIPLGATINMDGCCIYLCIIGLFLARAYGMELSVTSLVSLAVTIVLLSLGAPGVPGCAFICLGIVLKTLGIPLEALSLIIAINPILDMFDTMNNTTGDVAAAVIVSKREGLLDIEKFNS